MAAVCVWVFPLTWIAFICGCDAVWAYIIFFVIYFILIFVRVYLVKDLINMPWKSYLKDVLLICAVVLIMSSFFPYLLYFFMPKSIWRLILIIVVSAISTGMVIYWLGLSSAERDWLKWALDRYKDKIKYNGSR